jgi:hypothetical protein
MRCGRVSWCERLRCAGFLRRDQALRCYLSETRTATGWTTCECGPILLNGIAATDCSDGVWARPVKRQAHSLLDTWARFCSWWPRGVPAKVASASEGARDGNREPRDGESVNDGSRCDVEK